MAEVGNSDIAGNGSQAPAPSGARMCYSGWSYPLAEPCLFFKVAADFFAWSYLLIDRLEVTDTQACLLVCVWLENN